MIYAAIAASALLHLGIAFYLNRRIEKLWAAARQEPPRPTPPPPPPAPPVVAVYRDL